MIKFFRRLKKPNPAPSKRVPDRDAPLIGSELLSGKPQSVRDLMRPLRLQTQREYLAKGRHPDELAKVSKADRDEAFWMAYIDALMVFEREQEALRHAERAAADYPRNRLIAEMRMLLRRGLGIAPDR